VSATKIAIDTAALNHRLGKIQDRLPPGYKVALLVIHPSNPKAHVLVTDTTDAHIRQALDELSTPDTVTVLPGTLAAAPPPGEPR